MSSTARRGGLDRGSKGRRARRRRGRARRRNASCPRTSGSRFCVSAVRRRRQLQRQREVLRGRRRKRVRVSEWRDGEFPLLPVAQLQEPDSASASTEDPKRVPAPPPPPSRVLLFANPASPGRTPRRGASPPGPGAWAPTQVVEPVHELLPPQRRGDPRARAELGAHLRLLALTVRARLLRSHGGALSAGARRTRDARGGARPAAALRRAPPRARAVFGANKDASLRRRRLSSPRRARRSRRRRNAP